MEFGIKYSTRVDMPSNTYQPKLFNGNDVLAPKPCMTSQ